MVAHVRQQQLTVWERERESEGKEREGRRCAHETAGTVKMLQLLYLALICFNVYFTCISVCICVCESGRVHVCVISTQPKA